MLAPPDHKARQNRERVRRYAARHQAGIALARVPFDGRVLDGLIRAHLLAEKDVGDPQAIGRAIAMHLADEFYAVALKKFLLTH
jgi:hypothetical protein